MALSAQPKVVLDNLLVICVSLDFMPMMLVPMVAKLALMVNHLLQLEFLSLEFLVVLIALYNHTRIFRDNHLVSRVLLEDMVMEHLSQSVCSVNQVNFLIHPV